MFERILGFSIAICLVNTHDYDPVTINSPKKEKKEETIPAMFKNSRLDFSDLEKSRFDYEYDQDLCYG